MPNLRQKKDIVGEFFLFLTDAPGFEGCEDFPVVRLLVGDPNISEETARECAQDTEDRLVEGLDI